MKKVIVVSPHFPPSALPPAQRARLLVKNFKKNGYYPYVVTISQKYREDITDDWLVDLAGKDYTLINCKAVPYQITRKLKFGDLGLRAIPYLYFKLKKIIKKEKPDIVIYLVPPWYVLILSPIIKKITKTPYIIDFIDPWVSSGIKRKNSLKQKISQKIALYFEKKAVEKASGIISVSEGINNKLKERYPKAKNKPFSAIPYGVETDDFKMPVNRENNKQKIVRYIGAIWSDAHPVLDAFLKAFVLSSENLKLEFYGTSYAPKELSKPQLTPFIKKYPQLKNIVSENHLRVSYKKAVELTITSDWLILFGGMEPYYAASKLFGLIASRVPFLAFLHKDSFPAKFLTEINYPYLVMYSQNKMPQTCIKELVEKIKILNSNSNKIILDINHPLIKNHTAENMTKEFVSLFNKSIENDKFYQSY
jgi:glycosyltransferase involved in cell wall biosynthesis